MSEKNTRAPIISGPVLLCAGDPSQGESQEITYQNYEERNTALHVSDYAYSILICVCIDMHYGIYCICDILLYNIFYYEY